MSLNYALLSSNMNDTYDFLKNDYDTHGVNQKQFPKDPGTTWMYDFCTNYDTYAQTATFNPPAVSMISSPSLLNFTNKTMGTVISEYWAAQLIQGTPSYCSSISSISNDASKIASPIDDYLAQLGIMNESSPYYEHLFSFIENQVNSIIWTISESGSNCSSTYSAVVT